MTEKINRKKIILGYSIVINIFILFLFLFLLPNSFHINDNMDYINEYNPIALNIVNGESYNHVEPSVCLENCEDVKLAHLRRPPLFPLFIALSYKLEALTNINQYNLLIYLQYLLHLLSSILIFIIYLRWMKKINIAFFASVIYSSYPLGLYLLKQPNSEVIFNFLLCFFIFVFSVIIKEKKYLSGYYLLLPGAFLGLLILTRSLSIFFPIIIFIYIFLCFRRQAININLKLLIGMFIILIPWQIYSSSLSDNISQNDKQEIVESRNFSTTVFVYGLFWEQMPERPQSQSAQFMSDDLLQFMKDTYQKSSDGLLKSKREIFDYMLSQTIKSPLVIIELGVWKSLRTFFGTDSKRFELEVFLINFIYFSLLFFMFIKRKSFFSGVENKQFSTLFSMIFIYFLLISATVIPLARYSLSGFLIIVPLISILISNFEISKKCLPLIK